MAKAWYLFQSKCKFEDQMSWLFFPLRETYLLVWLVTVAGLIDPQDLSSRVFPFPSTIWDFNAQQRSLNNNEHWCQCQYWSESTMMEYHQIVPSASIGVLKAECSKGHLDGFPRSHADIVGLVLKKYVFFCHKSLANLKWKKQDRISGTWLIG